MTPGNSTARVEWNINVICLADPLTDMDNVRNPAKFVEGKHLPVAANDIGLVDCHITSHGIDGPREHKSEDDS